MERTATVTRWYCTGMEEGLTPLAPEEARSLQEFREHLLRHEKSEATIRKYLHDVQVFLRILQEVRGERGESGGTPTKEEVLTCKQRLVERYAVASVNSMLAAVNQYLKSLGRPDLCVRQLRQQKTGLGLSQTELSRAEVDRLLKTARSKRKTLLALGIETLAGTGIRVSELQYFTVENVRRGMIEVRNKGKIRRILLSTRLQKRLLNYCRRRRIRSGQIFLTSNGGMLNRSNFWRSMKLLAVEADVDPRKIYPHNLRHYFARMYYRKTRDLSGLADLLGHSSVNVTRIYTAEPLEQYKELLDDLYEEIL